MPGEAVVLAVVGVMASMVAVLVWLIKKQFDQNDTTKMELNTTIREGNEANKLLAGSINRLSVVSERNIAAIDASREESREFQKLVIAKLDGIDDKADRNYTAIVRQTVKEQTVEHQTVKSKD